ncbi:MAG TPA: sulfotransferase [Alphaproteobacteria bacterium]|nr:sulfotransferase [Alphaproteobacteria bacterium]HNS44300.1 sulfotransferase [Alphaproteobacteria bacterium]
MTSSLPEIQEMLKLGQTAEAEKNLVKSLKSNPNQPDAWRTLASIQIFVKVDFNSALESLTKAMALNPSDAETYYLMGCISQQMSQYDDSIELFGIGLQFAPTHTEMLSALGMSHLYKRHFNEAKYYVFKALSFDPENLNAFLNTLNIAELLPLSETEKTQLLGAIDKNRDKKIFSDSIFLFEARDHLNSKNLDAARECLDKVKATSEQMGAMKNFLYGDLMRKLGDHEKAFSYYREANALQAKSKEGKKFKLDTINQLIDTTRTLLSSDFITRLEETLEKTKTTPCLYPTPVFLIGFPRSGTTLTGKILNSHSKLFTADEYGAIDQIKIHMQQKFGLNLPKYLDKLTPDHITFMRDLYNEKQAGLPMTHKDKIFIDKMPLNTLHVPIIHAIFPDAKFLYVQRHPLDSTLSSFMQHFVLNSAMIHFLDLENAARLYKKTYNLWKFEKEKLPIKFYEFKYENMVNNFDEEIGKILDFVGVEWDDNVREFYKHDDSGPTSLSPSRTQISSDLYKEPQGRWKKYKSHLKRVIQILEPVINESGYSID